MTNTDTELMDALERYNAQDRIIADNNTLPPIGVYLGAPDDEHRSFYTFRDAARAILADEQAEAQPKTQDA